jgi:hypothetical protein
MEVTVGTTRNEQLWTGGLIVKNAHVGSAHRDAYWQATREQLKFAQKWADRFTLAGVVTICTLLWFYYEPGEQSGWWTAVGIGLVLVIIFVCVPLWFVTRRKRRITATRGLICQHCGYVPHDTEVVEVASTRHCQRCEKSLD